LHCKQKKFIHCIPPLYFPKILYAKLKRNRILIIITRISILIFFIALWEILSKLELINTFLTSSPSLVIKTIINLLNQNNLFNHILITIYETIISFLLSTIIGILISSILWWNKFLSKVLEPYLTVINSMPKVALGPILIIWIGANINSIVFMALLISVIITVINITNSFNNTDENKLKKLETSFFKASSFQY
jgi:NitT/TauT family transport system permease protein